MKVIGITGNSGSGKTTASKILEEKLSAYVIDADKVVKDMSQPGTEYFNAIKRVFGDNFFTDDGNINRKKLADEIYNQKDSLHRLNDLTFKYVKEEIENQISANKSENEYVVIDVPLLFEAGLDKSCDVVIAMVADDEKKIERIMERDGIDYATAKKRLDIQPDDDMYLEKADFIIDNSNDDELWQKLSEILQMI
ncbi:MAG: dephospho-CoA kinase [Clostridia bacterium]|nr:dephospho-CoA kinase [Clostridia bacterium]